jgi:hypothetical protein
MHVFAAKTFGGKLTKGETLHYNYYPQFKSCRIWGRVPNLGARTGRKF